MLQFLHQHGAKIMINSDCHNAKDLNCAFDVAIDLAKAAGYRSAVVLGQNSLFEEVGLDEIR
jgi:histidinol-phosphatase (PHP family)